jgi:hypothetical protein
MGGPESVMNSFERFIPDWGLFEIVFLMVLIAAGVYFVIHGTRNIRQARSSVTDWPTVQGVVIRAEIITKKRTGSSFAYSVPVIVYRYEIAGREYESNRVAFGDDPKGTAEEVVKRYAVGNRVKIHYEKQNPSEAVLEPGVRGVQYEFFIPGIIALIAAMIMVFSGIQNRMQRAEQYPLLQKSADVPQARPAPSAANAQDRNSPEEPPTPTRPRTADVQTTVTSAAEAKAPEAHSRPSDLNAKMFEALERGEWDDARAFIEQGADANARSASGVAPLILSIRSNWIEGTRLLLSKGADATIVSTDGDQTLLMIAVQNRSIDHAKLLLEKGVDPNRRDVRGKTALMTAMERRDRAMIRLLVENGADPTIADTSGQSALDMVHGFRNNDEIKALLLSAKKKPK